MKLYKLLPLLSLSALIPLAGCQSDAPQQEEIKEEVRVEEKTNIDDIKYLADNEAVVDTVLTEGIITEYFTNGSYAESIGDSVALYTPTEEVIRDRTGYVKVSDITVNAVNQTLDYRDGKVIISQTIGTFNPNNYSDNVKVVKANEKIIDVEHTTNVKFTTKEFSRDQYDLAFPERDTFVIGRKERKAQSIIGGKLMVIMENFRTEEVEKEKAELREEAKEQASIEASIEAENKETEHTHDFQPIYTTVHHDATSHQETYTEKEPYTYEVDIVEYQVYDTISGDTIATYDTEKEAINATESDTTLTYKSIVTGTEEKTDYREVQKTRTVTDSQGYDEQVVDHYECTICGERL